MYMHTTTVEMLFTISIGASFKVESQNKFLTQMTVHFTLENKSLFNIPILQCKLSCTLPTNNPRVAQAGTPCQT